MENHPLPGATIGLYLALSVLVCALQLAIVSLGQSAPPAQAAIRVNSSLVLVDVIIQDAKTGLPLQDLGENDFIVLDNDSAMDIRSFDVGARYGSRPISLWFVVICNEVDWDENGSGFIRERGDLLRPALEHLDKQDTLAVAHWCDDGKHQIDAMPSHDVDEVLKKLDGLFHRKRVRVGTREGEMSLQGMLRSILEVSRSTTPQPLPVVVFLYGDHSGMEREEADDVLKDLLETSVIVFGINDGMVRVSPIYLENQHAQPNVAHFLAAKTGGQFFSVKPELFPTALDDILVQVRFRYVLGFQPLELDGKRHSLTVQLTDSARTKFPDAKLAFRPVYIPMK
ncbi:MAG: hypothetical protein ABSG16_22015 [Candidatus Acidiferrum sp.]